MAKFSVKKALAVVGALTVLGAGVFFGIDAVSDDFNVVFHPDTNHTQPLPEPEPEPTPQPTPEPGELIQLASPEMVYNQEDNILSWNEVENASGYLVSVDGHEYQTKETQVQLNIEENTKYNITLKALGDGEKYKDSKTVSLSGVRQDLDQMYYQQIKDGLIDVLESRTIAFQKFDIHELLNIDFEDNKLYATVKCKVASQPTSTTKYTTFSFELNNQYNVSTLQDLVKVVEEIKSDSNMYIKPESVVYESYENNTECYDKLINDTLLNGQLKNYLDNGYNPEMLYACLSYGGAVDNFALDSYIKLTKGNDIKVVTVRNIVSQKFNNSFAFDGYVNAYINGTAEDVVIQETSFTEASAVSSMWQSANDKYDNLDIQLLNSKQNISKYETMTIEQNGKQYVLKYPVDDYSIEY